MQRKRARPGWSHRLLAQPRGSELLHVSSKEAGRALHVPTCLMPRLPPALEARQASEASGRMVVCGDPWLAATTRPRAN